MPSSAAADVILVQMPFGTTSWPSLGLGLLKSELTAVGIKSCIRHLNVAFERYLDPATYGLIASGYPGTWDLAGEWVFREALWGADPDLDRRYLEEIFEGRNEHHKKYSADLYKYPKDTLLFARSKVNQFLEECIESTDWETSKIVGFTSVFQQHVASLSLASRLKRKFPQLTIAFGGANLEAELGAPNLRIFPFIDAVCVGEGDRCFPAFASAVLRGESFDAPGILTRKQAPVATVANCHGDADAPHLPSLIQLGSNPVAVHASEKSPPVDLDSLPYPDYSDFFDAIDISQLETTLRIPFETSRGCWWGQKHHCTFCGLNGSTMQFRSKSPARALAEIEWLVESYGSYTKHFFATDNIIPMTYFDTFLPELERRNLGIDFFYETKANLTEQQVAQYARAGFIKLQPGIESLHSGTLKLMRKGVSAIQNIQLLKCCRKYGIEVMWHYLMGFPGEDPTSYQSQLSLIRQVVHLEPPTSCLVVRFDRFNPYQTQPEAFGLDGLKPLPAYDYVYSELSVDDLHEIAYFFIARQSLDLAYPPYAAGIAEQVEQWQRNSSKSALCHSTFQSQTTVLDTRDPEQVRVFILLGVYSRVLESCSVIVGTRKIQEQLQEAGFSAEEIEEAISDLLAEHLLIIEGNQLLGLSVPLGFKYEMPEGAQRRINDHLFDGLTEDGQSAAMIDSARCVVLGRVPIAV